MNYLDDLQSLLLSDEFTTEFTPPKIIFLMKNMLIPQFCLLQKINRNPFPNEEIPDYTICSPAESLYSHIVLKYMNDGNACTAFPI